MKGPILITGAGGFIGRHVVANLIGRGIPVRALDIQPTIVHPSVEFISGTVEDERLLREAMEGTTAVIHLAYRIDIDGLDPRATLNTNINGTTLVFETARHLRLRRVVWASSVMIYGAPELQKPGPVAEDGVLAPTTFYGAGKLFLEKLAVAFRRDGIETCGLRFTTVFGPGRDRGGAAPFAVELFTLPSRGQPILLQGGDRRLDFIYGPDAAEACVCAALAPQPLAAAYNAGGFAARVGELAEEVRRHLPEADITILPGGANPWPEELDGRAAARDFAWRPRFDRARAVADYLAYLRGTARTPDTAHTKGA